MNRLKNEKIATIARWLGRGLSVRQTASMAGANRNTVLRYKKQIANGAPVLAEETEPYLDDSKRVQIAPRVAPSVIERLEDEAHQRGMCRTSLAARVLEVVAKDDLFEAVLGE